MKKIIFLVLITSLISCTNIVREAANQFTAEYYIPNIENSIILPSSFKKSSSIDYLFKLFESEKDIQLIKSVEDGIYNMTNKKGDFSLLYDTTNINNSVMVYKLDEYFELNGQIGSVYLKHIEDYLYNAWFSRGIFYNKLESHYFKQGHLEYLKIKYDKKSNDDVMFFTQYIISSTFNKTFVVSINSDTKNDYEGLIKKLVIR